MARAYRSKMARQVGTVNVVYFPRLTDNLNAWFLSRRSSGCRSFIWALAVYIHSCVRYGLVLYGMRVSTFFGSIIAGVK